MKKLYKILILIIILLTVFFVIKIHKDTILKWFYIIKYSQYVEKYSKEYEVDKYLIYATIKVESNFNENAKSNKGAKGLMQLIDSTGEEIAQSIGMTIDNDDLFEPEINIKLGTKYLSTMLKKYSCIELALAAYNAGSGNVDNWIKSGIINIDGSNIEKIPFKETNNYVRKILRDYNIYKQLYKKGIK